MRQEIVAIEQDMLYPVVLCDQALLGGATDGIFIFSRDDGERKIAELAASVYRDAWHKNPLLAPLIIINGTTRKEWEERGVVFGGTEMWRSILLREGVLGSAILTAKTACHTGAEADELVHIAKERGLKKVIIMAMPYHILRCWLTAIKAMEKANYYLDIYNLTLPSLFWQKQAPKVLLDGTFEEGTRLDHIACEHARIKEYTEKGFCATREEALVYLAKRGKSHNMQCIAVAPIINRRV